ncbi:MAG: ABC transporter ATP-binding protein [Thermodesulfobacteriota bacterium]
MEDEVAGRPAEEGPMVELKGVGLWRDRMLLEGVDWTVEPGQHWIMLGRNGAGKTLLLKIIAGYLWPSRGRVRVLGQPYGQVDLRRLRTRIGWVSSALTEKIPEGDTALEVVLSGAYATFGLYREPPSGLAARARGLMEDLGLLGLAERGFGVLSAGEKQRVLLARALLPQPGLMILDEPCAGLDLAGREKFLRLVSKTIAAPGGPTVVMVTHRVTEITPGFTHALLLTRGRILAAGPLAEVLTGENLSRTMEIPLELSRLGDRWQVRVAPFGGL